MHQKIKCSWLFVQLLLVLAPMSANAEHNCPTWLAKVISTQGRVDSKYSTQSFWQLIDISAEFCQDDKIRTAKNSQVNLLLRKESRVTLKQKSQITISTAKQKPCPWFLEIIKGSFFFRSRESQCLNVKTPFINAVHEGTEFLVTVDDNQTTITVFDGQVAANNQNGEIKIKKGFTGIARKDQPPSLQALKIRPEDAVQWALYYPPIIDAQQAEFSKTENLQPAIKAYQQGNIHQALEYLDEIPATHQNTDYLTFKASLLLSSGSVDEAIKLLDKVQLTEASNSTAFALQSIIAVAKNRKNKALIHAENAVKLNPQSAVAQIALSYAHQSQFKIESALQATQEAIQLSPDNALAWARLAELQLSTGQRSKALESAQKAQTLNPKLDKTQIILGFAHLAQTDIDDAKAAFTKAIKLNTANPLARLGLGLAKIRKGAIEAGKSDLETAVSLDPDNAIMRSYLGKAYYELRNEEFASTELGIAKEMDPKDPTPWFYDAILKQTTNRPVEALHDMQKAIELNDNRGVYRSKLLLDEDLAIRGTSLARIYDTLGFEDIASLAATKSLSIDPSNHSAHRFLSDSFARRPRHEIARSSELFQSQLLQPININPVQPRLAITDLNITQGAGPAESTFNEFNSMFERNDYQFTTTGFFGSNNTLNDEAVISGIIDKFSYSFGQFHYETDGFRENNDLQSDLYNIYLQQEITPQINLQAEYRYRDTEHGDLEFKGNKNNFDINSRRSLEQSTYRLGLRFSPNPKNIFLISGIYSDRSETTSTIEVIPPFLGITFPDIDIEIKSEQLSHQLEAQHLFHEKHFNTITGGGAYFNDVERVIVINDPLSPEYFRNDQYFGYFYSNINFLDNLTTTFGISFDSYHDEQGEGIKIVKWNPKFGFRWNFKNFLTLRLASFRTLKPSIIANQILQPTQVAGFNQYYDDDNGTITEQHSLGIDVQFSKNFYTGFEIYKRDSESPALISTDTGEIKLLFRDEELYRVYVNWIPHTNWSLNSEFRSERFSLDPGDSSVILVKTEYILTNLSFFHSSGFFASVEGTFINQVVNDSSNEQDNFKSDFFLVDAAIGFKLPKNYGLISLEGKNLFNTDFKFRDRNFQMNEERTSEYIPEQTLFVRLTLNF